MARMTEAEGVQRISDRAAARARKDALNAEDGHRRAQAQRALWVREDMYLTREQVAGGERCRGCGLVVNDGRGSWGGTMHLSPEEKAEYDADDAAWRERHGECHAGRWSLAGSRTRHCMQCCPPPALPDDAVERVHRILLHETPEIQLDEWRSTLTCGHSNLAKVHESNRRSYHASGVTYCPKCETHRGVVAVEYLGPVVSPETVETRRQAAAREADLDAARREVADRKKALAEAERRVRQLRTGK